MVNEERSMRGNLLLGTMEGSYKSTTPNRGGVIDTESNDGLGVLNPGVDRQRMPPVSDLAFPGGTFVKMRGDRRMH